MLLNVQIDDDLHRQVKDVSETTGVSISFVVRNALKSWVDAVAAEKATDRLIEIQEENQSK